MFNPYSYQPSLERINRQIEDLQNLKMQMQNPQPMQPVNNFINNTPQTQGQNMYELKKLNDNDEVENLGILADTIFIGSTKMQIKKTDGTIEKYNITKYYPVDPKDEKISQLEEEVKKLKEMISSEPKYVEPNKAVQTFDEQREFRNVDVKPTAKGNNK